MKFFLDSSDIDEISELREFQMIDGVTTNPSLMLKAGKDPLSVIKDISDLFDPTASISAEVVGETAEEMLSAAIPYTQYAKNITIKVPCTWEGLKACRTLTDAGVDVNVTLIFSVAQAIMAAKAGAKYVSPFVGRCNDNSFSGVELIRAIAQTFGTQRIAHTEILAASLRDCHHVSRCFMYGADIVTAPYKVWKKMPNHVLTDAGLDLFNNDWESLQSKL